MSQANSGTRLPPPLVALAGWLIPGAGYWAIGEFARGTVVCAAIIVLYLSGLLVAGVRVIEVPGYDSQTGQQVLMINGQRLQARDRTYPNAGWALTSGGFVSELTAKPWFVGQILAGPVSLVSAAASIQLALSNDAPRPHAPLETVGTLYTAIAGMLNLLVIIDAVHRAGQPPGAGTEQPVGGI
ncbi:MAG TPA: DUF6677 family protein [Tepidisphaeraceae bacterium]|nr:DUF6677 family protein [Tepidisphaeraceae bacterium]